MIDKEKDEIQKKLKMKKRQSGESRSINKLLDIAVILLAAR